MRAAVREQINAPFMTSEHTHADTFSGYRRNQTNPSHLTPAGTNSAGKIKVTHNVKKKGLMTQKAAVGRNLSDLRMCQVSVAAAPQMFFLDPSYCSYP